ncbi:DNA-binding protein K10 [Teleopsis dalmanni]|uniref:DNA-binding protein K10 n=1 Tax=Teleopsis dalmanni TaxID=139649 RepID=UPI0018CF71A7|nr:DNA-binding protein K10 [Teleopsis dalmanni]
MVSKKNFQHGKIQHKLATMPYNKPPTKSLNQIMFNGTQIPDNPGYTDFNNPVSGTSNQNSGSLQQKKKKNRQKNKQINMQQSQQKNGSKNWNHKNGLGRNGGGAHDRFNGKMLNNNFNNMQNRNGPNRGRRMPPMGFGLHQGPMGPMPPMPHNFQPPMIPPMPPMPPMGGVQPPPPPYFRRNGRNMPLPHPPPINFKPPMMPPHGPPALPYNGVGKLKKTNSKVVKKSTKSKNTIKTLKNLVNQYPIDKPWVTDEIRKEYEKKIDIENRLKGNKDDELFAQFKLQRDKFVGLYDAAREAYLKTVASAAQTKDINDKKTNNKIDTKDETNKEEIPKVES